MRSRRRPAPTRSSRCSQRHGIRVVVANTRKLRSITEAKAKTDRLDARTLARLLASGLLDDGVDSGRAYAGAAAADQPPRAARASPYAREERGAWGLGARPLRAPAGHRCVRQGRPALAGWARAARRRAPDARRLPAPGRLPRPRDRRARRRDRQAGARLAGGAAADERPRRQRADRGRVHGLGRRHPPLLLAAQARQLPRPRPARAPVRQQPGSARTHLQGRRLRGQAHARRGGLEGDAHARARCARSSSASVPAAARRSQRPRPRASSSCSSGTCSPAKRTTPSRARR